jgi:hypothetical protein
MKTYGKVQVWLHAFMTSELEGCTRIILGQGCRGSKANSSVTQPAVYIDWDVKGYVNAQEKQQWPISRHRYTQIE